MLRRLAISLCVTIIAVGAMSARSDAKPLSGCWWTVCDASDFGYCPGDGGQQDCMNSAPAGCGAIIAYCAPNDGADCPGDHEAYIQCSAQPQ